MLNNVVKKIVPKYIAIQNLKFTPSLDLPISINGTLGQKTQNHLSLSFFLFPISSQQVLSFLSQLRDIPVVMIKS